LDADTKASLIAAAEAQQAKKAALAEEQAIIDARKNDPVFKSLGKELKTVKGEKTEKVAHETYDNAQADIVALAQKKKEERAAAEADQAIMQQRAHDPTIKALGSELKNVVGEKTFKHNNEAAKSAIAERDAANPAISDILKAVKKEE
jgi:plasmid replication initiation protein